MIQSESGEPRGGCATRQAWSVIPRASLSPGVALGSRSRRTACDAQSPASYIACISAVVISARCAKQRGHVLDGREAEDRRAQVHHVAVDVLPE